MTSFKDRTAPRPTNRHALFATTESGITFRVGQPVGWHRAQKRWEKRDGLAPQMEPRKAQHVRFDGKRHAVRFFEVRAVDSHGRGLGAERHTIAFPVPFRNLRITR